MNTALTVILCSQMLAELHSQGIAHRDLSDANLFVGFDASGFPYWRIIDFAYAQISGEKGLGTFEFGYLEHGSVDLGSKCSGCTF